MAREPWRRSTGAVLVGTWLLDGYQCRLVGRRDWRGGQGEGRLPHMADPFALIEVGIGGSWADAVESLCHETFEFVLTSMGLVWGAPLIALRQDCGTRTFIFNHEQYAEAMRRAADFIAEALSGKRALWREWRRANKEGKRC